jgi:hypothetical protein
MGPNSTDYFDRIGKLVVREVGWVTYNASVTLAVLGLRLAS